MASQLNEQGHEDFAESPHLRVMREIARDIIGRPLGGRIPSNIEYQRMFDAGSGTVQKALQTLSASGAMDLRSRGHQGTSIERQELGRLWAASGYAPLRAVLTPPGAVENFALETGLRQALTELGVAVTINYVSGAQRRVDSVVNGVADVAVVSRGFVTARTLEGHGAPVHSLELDDDTYYTADSIVVVDRENAPATSPLRVGIDSTSYDHTALTKAEFARHPDIEYVECRFRRIPAAILEGAIDTGVWHWLNTLIPLPVVGLRTRSLLSDEAQQVRRRLSAASLVMKDDAPHIHRVLKDMPVSVLRAAHAKALSLDPQHDDFDQSIYAQ